MTEDGSEDTEETAQFGQIMGFWWIQMALAIIWKMDEHGSLYVGKTRQLWCSADSILIHPGIERSVFPEIHDIPH